MTDSDPRTHEAPATFGKLEFDRIPSTDAELIQEALQDGCHAQKSDTARRNFVNKVIQLAQAYQREMWP